MKDAHPFVYSREPYKQRPLNSILVGSRNPVVVREKKTITSASAQSVEFLSDPLLIRKSTQDPLKCVSGLFKIQIRWGLSIRISKAFVSQQHVPLFPSSKLIDSLLNPSRPDESIKILKQSPGGVDQCRSRLSRLNGPASDSDGPCRQDNGTEQQKRDHRLPG